MVLWRLTMAWLPIVALVAKGAVAIAVEPAAFDTDIRPVLQARCIRCHGPEKQSGDVRLDRLTADVASDLELWRGVHDQLQEGTMPPEDEPALAPGESQALLTWLSAELIRRAPQLPNQGNLIPHELLFGKPADAPAAASPGRVWRLSPEGYLGFVREVHRGRPGGIVQPFTVTSERGIKDFAALYTIDEPTTEILLRNAAAIVEAQTWHQIEDGVVRAQGHDTVRDFVALMDPAREPAREELEKAIQLQFRMAIGRRASDDDVERLVGLYEKCATAGDRPGAVKTMLQAVLLRTDAMFRRELGEGSGAGRRMLAPDELARALSLALADRREPSLVRAAEQGELAAREQIAGHVRRVLEDSQIEKPRLLRFFREYFDYGKAGEVFKDRPKTFKHEPEGLVRDTDRLVLHILESDQDVLRQLLTTPLTFANYSTKLNKQTREHEPLPASQPDPPNKRGENARFAPEHVYGFAEWPHPQPTAAPSETRLGILMQPSWLVAFSTNFDNDPVRRGRWVRERLLGGTVPDLPIGVVAQVPDDPHRTFRDRLQVTRAAQCWKCHRMMDDLGLPFENFDHFGRFRTTETVLDPAATAANVDKNGKSLGDVTREAELDTSGAVAFTGDARLDGPVRDPRELLRRLADSERVRQVFVRHAFRYFLGRNESLADARTLQEADRAYVAGGGSFRALVVSLLTSDAFLYRTVETEATAATPPPLPAGESP